MPNAATQANENATPAETLGIFGYPELQLGMKIGEYKAQNLPDGEWTFGPTSKHVIEGQLETIPGTIENAFKAGTLSSSDFETAETNEKFFPEKYKKTCHPALWGRLLASLRASFGEPVSTTINDLDASVADYDQRLQKLVFTHLDWMEEVKACRQYPSCEVHNGGFAPYYTARLDFKSKADATVHLFLPSLNFYVQANQSVTRIASCRLSVDIKQP